jgi:outer membrane lipoprotein carrier protein
MNRILLKKTILATALTLAISSHAFAVEVKTSNATEQAQSSSATVAAKALLMKKLAKISFFTADFTQEIVDEEGTVLQQGAGHLAMSKPNLVHWQTTEPDETLIVSDGQSLWFYDPFIEQATVYQLEKAIANTPILLLTNESPALWQGYRVNQQSANTFEVAALAENSQIKTLTLHFNGDKLRQFSMLDASGQLSHFRLSQVNYKDKPATTLFHFEAPQGTRVEDQR